MAPSSPSPAVAAANPPAPAGASTCKQHSSASASASVKNKVKAAHRARKTRAPRRKNAEDYDDECAKEPDQDALADDEADADMAATRRVGRQPAARAREDGDPEFVGDPIPDEEARATWPKRYQRAVTVAVGKRNGEEVKVQVKARRHYRAAKVDEIVYNLGDHVQMAEHGGPNYFGKITELFEGTDHGQYFICGWFFRPTELVDDNDTSESSGISSDGDSEAEPSVTTAAGLRLGTKLADLKLETRCEVDFNSLPCKSLKSNHPQIEVRNKKADDFLSLLKECGLLCDKSRAPHNKLHASRQCGGGPCR